MKKTIKIKTKVVLGCFSLLSAMSMSANSFAATGTLATKATATLAASCRISAQSISFGAIATPLYAQSATSNMTVFCSKQAPYTIDLNFGLSANYWGLTGSGGAYADATWSARVNLYDGTGKVISSGGYGYPRNGDPLLAMESAMGCKFAADGKCHTVQTSSESGNLLGVKGNSISYTILIPGDSSKVWSMGKNSYKATGIGDTQTIPILAKIVPGSTVAYPAPDMYTDTVMATITY